MKSSAILLFYQVFLIFLISIYDLEALPCQYLIIIIMIKNIIFGTKLVRRFCFFNQKISQKYGKKCCRYNQDGKPMAEAKANQLFNGLKTFLKGWKLNQQGKRLMKYYYVQDYPSVLKFINEVVQIDAGQFKQCPSYHVTNGQILCLEVYSPPLQGLSLLDFQLAMRINNLNFSKYHLLELEDEKNYKKQVSKVRMQRQSKKIQAMLAEDEKNWEKNKNKEEIKEVKN